MNIPEITLNNNVKIPCIGYGTCKHSFDRPIDEIILQAMECGYRYFDTASFYQTERDLGKAVRESGLKREELTIATKFWYEELGYQKTKDALHRSLDRLGLDYVDFYLVHWPKASEDDPDWKKTLADSWLAMEEMKNEGLIKSLGVSNFLPHHLEVLKTTAKELPVIDQLELHLGYFQEYAVRYLYENNIKIQAWSPMGRGREKFNTNRVFNKMAEKYNVSVQKLSLRFLIQRNVMPLPFTLSKEHMKENLEALEFEISDEDMSMLSCIPQETWLGEHPDFFLPSGKHVNLNQ